MADEDVVRAVSYVEAEVSGGLSDLSKKMDQVIALLERIATNTRR